MTTRPRRTRRIPIRGGLIAAVVVAIVAGIATNSGNSGNSGKSGVQGATATHPATQAAQAVDPTRFVSGACMAYPPTTGDNHRTVFLDAGHGGIDPGSVGRTTSGKTIEEADLTLPVELDAMALLRAKGYRVVVSRTRSSTVARMTPADLDGNLMTAQGVHDDVAARAICANEGHADVLVGIYFDAGAPDNAGSVTGWDAARPFAAKNLKLARLVQHDVLHAMNAQGWGIPSEGVQPDEDLGSSINSIANQYGHLMLLGPAYQNWFTTPSEMPGALIEPLFITDPFEGSIADSAKGQKVIAGGIAQAVEQFFAPPRAVRGGKRTKKT